MMKIVKLPNLENREIKAKDYDKPTFTAKVFQPYSRVSISGSSGTGKSNAFINYFNRVYPELDKTYIVSATIYNDPKQQQAFLNKDNVVVFTEPSIEVIKSIIKDAEDIGEQHNDYLRMKKIYKKFEDNEFNEACLSPMELLELYKYQFDLTNMPYHKDKRPNLLLFLDDLQGLDILRHKIFENLIIKARHKNLNVFLTTQTFKGVSPVWRRNCSGFMIFKTIDTNQLRDIFTEIQGLFKSYEEFENIYKYATENKHEFLYIDMNDKENPIRKNFDLSIKI